MPSQPFPAWPESVPAARHYVGEILDQFPGGLCRTAELLVSELATNAVRHAGGRDFVVEVQAFTEEGRVWIGVTDTGDGLPVMRAPSVTAEHGRGMHLVSTLADRWGARRRRDTSAKTVWFELHHAPVDLAG